MGDRDKPNIINTLQLKPEMLEELNERLQRKYGLIEEKEIRFEEINTEDAELVLVAYGITSRIAFTAMEMARAEGIKVGLFRPITLWPFPKKALANAVKNATDVLTVELSAGQMVEDVNLAIKCAKPVHFYGRTGGMMMSPKEVYEQIVKIVNIKGGK